MPNLCGINQQIFSDTLHALRKEKGINSLQRQGAAAVAFPINCIFASNLALKFCSHCQVLRKVGPGQNPQLPGQVRKRDPRVLLKRKRKSSNGSALRQSATLLQIWPRNLVPNSGNTGSMISTFLKFLAKAVSERYCMEIWSTLKFILNDLFNRFCWLSWGAAIRITRSSAWRRTWCSRTTTSSAPWSRGKSWPSDASTPSYVISSAHGEQMWVLS